MGNQSPYFTGAAPNFGPPSGMAGLIGQDRAIASSGQQGWKDFADVAEKYKRQQDMGKAADYAVKANPDILARLNIHPDEWKTLGARDKTAALSGFMEAQAQQGVMQKFAEAAQLMKMRQQSIDAQTDFGQAMGDAQGRAVVDTLNRGNGPVPPRAVTMQDFAEAAGRRPNAWNAPGARPIIESLMEPNGGAAGMNAEANLLNARANYSRATQPRTATLPAGVPEVPGYTAVPDGSGGFKYLPTKPSATAEAEMSKLRNRRDMLKAQLGTYDQEIASGNRKPGWDLMGGKTYADMKREVEQQLSDVDAQLTDLSNGRSPVATPAAGGKDDLWSEFLKSRK